ncbi:MAG: Nudix family hydrolase [Gammaproteobacteria bacterium]|nr:Nudix family hydrolase [Gammaproteobacteria bacterium]
MKDSQQPPLGPAPSALGPDPAEGLVHVAAAALVDGEGRVLLAKRPDGAHQGGLWEFPGGKLEPGEDIAVGLRRELREELGVDPLRHRPLIRVFHHYADRRVLLDVHRVERWRGEPHGREGQPIAWVAVDALRDYPMPPADVPIVSALQLPPTYVITQPQLHDPARFLRSLSASLDAGAGLVQLRLFDVPAGEFVAVGREACALCHARGARVLLNGDPQTMRAIGADGLHLNSQRLHATADRPVAHDDLLAASCHTAGDLAQALRIGADFALLSPVLPTRSHPDAEPLGWSAFAALVDDAALPVYALGGMQPSLLDTAWRHGAQGVAGIRGLWIDAT